MKIIHFTREQSSLLQIFHSFFFFTQKKKKQSDKIDLRSAVLYLILSGADIADLDLKIKSSSKN